MPSLLSFLRLPLILLLVAALMCVGCVTPTTYSAQIDADAALTTADVGADAELGQGLQTTGHGEAALAFWILAGMMIAAVVTIDLLLLPFTYHDPFPCCRGVVTICD